VRNPHRSSQLLQLTAARLVQSFNVVHFRHPLED